MDFAIRKEARDRFRDIKGDLAALPGTASAPAAVRFRIYGQVARC